MKVCGRNSSARSKPKKVFFWGGGSPEARVSCWAKIRVVLISKEYFFGSTPSSRSPASIRFPRCLAPSHACFNTRPTCNHNFQESKRKRGPQDSFHFPLSLSPTLKIKKEIVFFHVNVIFRELNGPSLSFPFSLARDASIFFLFPAPAT